jgi:hypothetical protein
MEEQSTVSDNRSPLKSGHDCNQMFAVAQRWLETWHQTGDARHLDTALACHRIAKERLASFRTVMQEHRLKRSSIHAEYEMQTERIMAQIEESLAAARHLLRATR